MAVMAFVASASPLSRWRYATVAGTTRTLPGSRRPAACRSLLPRAAATPPPPSPPPPAASLASVGRRALPSAAWAAYVTHLFLAQPASITTTSADAFREAVDLSLNFLFILPVVSPSVAPAVDPTVEGLFMLVVGWAGVLWVFAADGFAGVAATTEGGGGASRRAGTPRPGVPVVPFLVGALFLTNGMQRGCGARPHPCARTVGQDGVLEGVVATDTYDKREGLQGGARG